MTVWIAIWSGMVGIGIGLVAYHVWWMRKHGNGRKF